MRGFRLLFLTTVAAGTILPASAIVWRGDKPFPNATRGADEPSPVGTLTYSNNPYDKRTAILIDDKFVLTAGHNIPPIGVTNSFIVNGREVQITGWIRDPRFKRAGNLGDVAIARLAERITDVMPAGFSGQNPKLNQAIEIIACGPSGPAGGTLVNDARPITGTNRISNVSATFLRTVFDAPTSRSVTEFESHLVQGDSGGGIFEAGSWPKQLLGVALTRSGAGYRASANFIRTSGTTLDWIRANAWETGRVEVRFDFGGATPSAPGTEVAFKITEGNSATIADSATIPTDRRGRISTATPWRGWGFVHVHVPRFAAECQGIVLNNNKLEPLTIRLKLGDANGDGAINALDLAAVQSWWGAQTVLLPQAAGADMNLDGVVDQVDFDLVEAAVDSN